MANVPSPTLGSWVEQWRTLGVDLKPKTVATYEVLLKNHILPVFGDTPIEGVTPLAIRTWVADMQRQGKSPARVHQSYRLLSGILRVAVDCDLLARSPCRGVRLPRQQAGEWRFLTADEVLSVAESVPGRYRSLVLVLGVSGLRWGEAVALRRAVCDLGRGRLVVKESLADVGGHLHFGTTKTGKVREVVIPPFLVEELIQHLAAVPPAEDALLFATPTGTPLRGCNFIRRVWRPALKKAGIEGRVRIHDLRHTAASLMIASGANIKAVQHQLGHATATMTLDRYAHLMGSTQDELSLSLEAIHSGSKAGHDSR